MKTRFTLLLVIFASGILTACAPARQIGVEPIAPSRAPTSQATPTAQTPPTSSVIPTDTATPSPTATKLPTLQPTTSPTALPTVNPALSLILIKLAEWYYQRDDFEMYIALHKELVGYEQDEDQQAISYDLIAEGYEKLGDFENATVYYLKAYEIDPDIESISNQLCWDFGLLEQAQKALPFCEEAVQINPGPAERDSRGLVYAMSGNYQEAREDFRVVVDEFEDSQDPNGIEVYETRKAWIETLQTGHNPITQAVLEELRSTSSADSALPTQEISQRTTGISTEGFLKAVEKEGFTDIHAVADETELATTEGLKVDGECTSRLSWSEYNQVVVLSALQMENCTDAEKQGLALWLVDLLFQNKSDKAKAFVWSFTELYSVIESDEYVTCEETVGEFGLTAGFDPLPNKFFIIVGIQ